MIINFNIQNFGSIKDKQTLSFEADKSKHLEDYYVMNVGDFRLLKLGLIYGANASGKTTILKALDFLRTLVLNPEEKKTNKLGLTPFLFDAHTPRQNTILSIDFIQAGTRYFYEVELNKNAITREELTFYSPNKANVFRRTTNIEKQFSEITFGNKIKKDKFFEKTLAANTLWNNTVLGGFLKTNIESKELREVTDWFEDYLRPLIFTRTDLEIPVTSLIQDSEISKKKIINILKKADFDISDIVVEKEEHHVTEDFLEFLKFQKAPIEKIEDLKNKGVISSLSVEFEHTINGVTYKLPFESESEGTQRYYSFAGILSSLIDDSIVASIDELEASLHPDLFHHFLLSFLVNAKQSQLIATTHNREILNDRTIFRTDAIWFTDKSKKSATELYALSDIDSSIVRDTTNVLNVYKLGKIGAIPNLGDYYIDADDEEK